jgi:5-formyltetrahydrofolate cyclo-ligase
MTNATPIDATPAGWDEIRAWRKQTRETLIAQRLAVATHVRLARGQTAKQRLLEAVDFSAHPTLGIYWPMRGEMDVRDIARKHIETGGVVGLPVVVERSAPVEFWKWQPGMKMRRGIWDIPIPAEREVLNPDVLVIPLVGFDAQGYRLGYGGGYYDRTIAAAPRRPFCVGLGFSEAHLPTIFPQPHDMPMDLIVTDRIVHRLAATSPAAQMARPAIF